MRQLPLGVRLPDPAVFASFVPEANTEALAHVRRLADGEGGSLTWLCGPAGCGKTHLLQATCAAAGDRMRAAYLPLAQLGCVCLDDLERVVGQIDWEHALFALLHGLEDAGGRLLMAARVPPALLGWALPDLGSRCAAGAVFQLRALEEDGQRAALMLRARLRGLELPEETWQWLRRRLPREMRALYEVLDTLDAAALAAQRRLTVPFIREVLAARGSGGQDP